jgi:hypothetical protein
VSGRTEVEYKLLGEYGIYTRWSRQHTDEAKRQQYAERAAALRPQLAAARARRKAAEHLALAEKWAEAAERGTVA